MRSSVMKKTFLDGPIRKLLFWRPIRRQRKRQITKMPIQRSTY